MSKLKALFKAIVGSEGSIPKPGTVTNVSPKHVRYMSKDDLKHHMIGYALLYHIFDVPRRVQILRDIRYKPKKTKHQATHKHRPAGYKMLKKYNPAQFDRRQARAE